MSTGLQRMCSECREPIANGIESMCLNGGFVHVECVAAAMRDADRCTPECARMMAERDEWKRRAEAAEAELVDPRRTIRVATDGDLVELGSVHDCGRLELVVTRRDNEVLPGRHFLAEQVMRESGPGIAATKPADDGHYIDPLDLLAADAP